MINTFVLFEWNVKKRSKNVPYLNKQTSKSKKKLSDSFHRNCVILSLENLNKTLNSKSLKEKIIVKKCFVNTIFRFSDKSCFLVK